MAKKTVKYDGVDILKWVTQLKAVRDAIDDIEEKHKSELAPYKQLYEKLSGTLLEYLDNTRQESAKTAAGTVYVSIRNTAALSDADAFMNHIIETQEFELLERRANATACREYAEQHGHLPPGVKLNVLRSARVRTSS